MQPQFTMRERMIVDHLAKGCTNKEIGEALEVSEGMIKNYLKVIFNKAGVWNRTELAMWWLKHGPR